MKTRRVTPEDVDTLQRIGRGTFADTFSFANKEENMREYLETQFSKDALLNELNNKNSEFYFAESDDRIIGYIKINVGDAQTNFKEQNAMEIERIYSIKDYIGRGVGQFLCAKAIALAKEKKVDFVWLGVWEENPRAIRFYEKSGFVAFDTHFFMLGDDKQTDILMKMELK